MSRATPRKTRHQHTPSAGARRSAGGNGDMSDTMNGGSQLAYSQQQSYQQSYQYSGYETAAAAAAATTTGGGGSAGPDTHAAGADAPIESLTHMNLRVLRQYEPSIRAILATAASTVVYVLNYDTGGWEKPEPQVEGTLFLCEQEPLAVGDEFSLPRACVFVLNRRGIMNVVVDLARVNVAEVTGDLITLRIDRGAPAVNGGAGTDAADRPPVLGFWIHGGTASDVAVPFNPAMVQDCWQSVRSALEQVLGTAELSATAEVLDAAETAAALEKRAAGEDPEGMATRAVGRRPSISELVATALGVSGGGQ